jgi:N-acetylglucosaminyl-diphospho-decaprenol L-rhamnosyltransferase
MTASVDVVIPTYGNWQLTERCISLLRGQTVEHEVIVADNGSTDGTPEQLRALFPHVRLVELGANLGFAAACNRGVADGEGEVVVLLNNDVECPPDFLERLLAPLDDEGVGMVAAVLVRPGEVEIDGVGLTADLTLAGFARLHGRPLAEASSTRPTLVGPSGGAGAYRRTAWEAAGGLDERFFFYSEDLDLALRLRSAGWLAAVAPDAVGVHLGAATAGPRSPWQRYQGGFARGYLLRRYGVLRSPAAARALLTEGIVVAGDAVISRDLSALRGRVDGWRGARGLPRHAPPPSDFLDAGIGFGESLRLRRQAYAG